MNCQDIQDRLGLWPDGSDGIDDFPAFMKHVNECPQCQLALEQIDRIACMLGDLPMPELPRNLEAQIMRTWQREQSPRKVRHSHLIYLAGGVAALFIFGLAMVMRLDPLGQHGMVAYEQAALEDFSGEEIGAFSVDEGVAAPASGENAEMMRTFSLPESETESAAGKQAEGVAGQNGLESAPSEKVTTMSLPVATPEDAQVAAVKSLGVASPSTVDFVYRGRWAKLTVVWQDDSLYLPIYDAARMLDMMVELNPGDKTAQLNGQQVKAISRDGIWFCSQEALAQASKLNVVWKPETNQLVVQ